MQTQIGQMKTRKLTHPIFTFLYLLTITGPVMAQQQGINYPQTNKTDVTDNYHGTIVADPYRWLEDDNSPETKAWVTAQNTVTSAYLNKIPFRGAIRKRLEELWNYPKVGAPFKKGDYYYFYKNDGLQNQSV